LFENFLLVGRDGLILRGVGVVSHGGEARIPEREREHYYDYECEFGEISRGNNFLFLEAKR
jgi:hypothetical protein